MIEPTIEPPVLDPPVVDPPVVDPPVDPPEPDAPRGRELARQRLTEAETRASTAEALASAATGRLVESMAGATGLLADPSDLARFVVPEQVLGDDGLPDVGKVQAAVEELVAERPHLRSRRPAGGLDVGQGGRAARPAGVDLASMLRAAAS